MTEIMKTEVKVKLLRPGAKMPVKATEGSAGWDVWVPEDITITRQRALVPLGFALLLPPGYCAKIRPRSGQSSKGMEGLEVEAPRRFDADTVVGLVDADYTGEVHIIIHKRDSRPMTLKAGTRIAQMTIERMPEVELIETTGKLPATQRGEGGFGHTGIEQL